MVVFVKCTQGKHGGYVGKVVGQKSAAHLTLKWGLPWTTPAVVPGSDCVPLGYSISVQQLHNHNMATYALQEEDWDPGGLRVHFVHLRLLRDALITHLAGCGRSSFLQPRAADLKLCARDRRRHTVPLSRLVDGEPGLSISPKCQTLPKAMGGGYAYKRVQVSGDERFHDKPDMNQYSHVAEAAQYLMLGAGEGRAIVRHHTPGPQKTIQSDQGWSVFA